MTDSRTRWWVVKVHARPDFQLSVEFVDETIGEVNVRPLIFSEDAGVFESFRDPGRDVGRDEDDNDGDHDED